MTIPENRTLQAALAAQQDLQALCADRPQPARELFPPNAYYGMAEIIKTYAGLPLEHRLRVIVPHGVVFNANYVWESEIRANLPVVFCYPDYRVNAYKARTDKYVWQATSPYVYLVESLVDLPKPERQGTLFFPAHSTQHITTDMDFADLAQRLRGLEDEFQPVTVCLYWRDIQLGRAEAFTRAGHQVVSAGHIADPAFLYRLYHFCSMHRYASSNEFGSHTFYSLLSGCSFFWINTPELLKAAPETVLNRDTAPPSIDHLYTLQALFTPRYREPSPLQLKTAQEYLGVQNKVKPRELKQILRKACWADFLGFVNFRSQKNKLKLPSFWRRVQAKTKFASANLTRGRLR